MQEYLAEIEREDAAETEREKEKKKREEEAIKERKRKEEEREETEERERKEAEKQKNNDRNIFADDERGSIKRHEDSGEYDNGKKDRRKNERMVEGMGGTAEGGGQVKEGNEKGGEFRTITTSEEQQQPRRNGSESGANRRQFVVEREGKFELGKYSGAPLGRFRF